MTSAEPVIEPFTVGLLDAAAALFVEVFAAEPWSETWPYDIALARMDALVRTPGFVGVAAREGAQLIGFALGQKEPWLSGAHFQLREMCVRADRRRTGIGRRLLAGLESALVDVEQIYLLTARETPAQAFYASLGFRSARRQHVMTRAL